jgi:hypothetical protein
LERTRDARVSEIRGNAGTAEFDVELELDRLAADVGDAALAHGGDYWVGRALDWLETGPGIAIPTEALLAFINDRKRPQRLRHRARSLLVQREK